MAVSITFSQRKKLRHGENSPILVMATLSRTPRFPDAPELRPHLLPDVASREHLPPTAHTPWWPAYMWDSQHRVARLSHKWLGHLLEDSVNKPRSVTTGQDYLLSRPGPLGWRYCSATGIPFSG